MPVTRLGFDPYRLMDRGRDARIDDELLGAVDEFQIDVGPARGDRIQDRGLEMEAQGIVQVTQHHVMAVQEHGAGGHQALPGPQFDMVHQFTDLQTVEQILTVRVGRDGRDLLGGQGLLETKDLTLRTQDQIAVAIEREPRGNLQRILTNQPMDRHRGEAVLRGTEDQASDSQTRHHDALQILPDAIGMDRGGDAQLEIAVLAVETGCPERKNVDAQASQPAARGEDEVRFAIAGELAKGRRDGEAGRDDETFVIRVEKCGDPTVTGFWGRVHRRFLGIAVDNEDMDEL